VGSHHMQPREAIAKEFGVTRFADVDWRPRHNVAPSQIIRDHHLRQRAPGPMRWGFV
jgi:putative SOS response-associated peptidase YedK